MKNLEMQSKAFNSKWLVINILIVVAIICLYKGYGYIFVIDAPQDAYLIEQPTVHIQGVNIDQVSAVFDDTHWTGSVDKPMRYLSGVKYINLFSSTLTEKGIRYIGISICPTTMEINDDTFDVTNSLLVIGVQVETIEGKYYHSAWTRDAAYCSGLLDGHLNAELYERSPPKGTIYIDNYNQSFRHLTLIGKMTSLKMPLMGHDGQQDIFVMEIQNLSFNINSPVIYQWSNKAGKIWRL